MALNIDENTGKLVDQYLNDINYDYGSGYIPSDFALEFINFLKLVNGAEGEENESPVLHYLILDQIYGRTKNIANMIFRGSGKTSVLGEYMFLYLGVYNKIPGFGEVGLAMYVSDSIDNGVKNMRKNLEHRWENSEFLQTYIPNIKFTDTRWEFNNAAGGKFIVKGYGAKALALDTRLYTDNGFTTMEKVQVGDKLYSPSGKPAKVIAKSEIFNKPMYRIVLKDGRSLKVSEDHLNAITIKKDRKIAGKRCTTYIDSVVDTKTLLQMKLRTGTNQYLFIKNTLPVRYSWKDLPVEPYLLGLLLGDGFMPEGKGVRISGLLEDVEEYLEHVEWENIYVAKYTERSGKAMCRVSFKGIYPLVEEAGIRGCRDVSKYIPQEYLWGCEEQRRELLAGLLDTDGTISKDGRVSYSTVSKSLSLGILDLARSLGYTASLSVSKNRKGSRKDLYRVYIRGDENPFKLKRKACLFRVPDRYLPLVGIDYIEPIKLEPSQCISIDSEDHLYLTEGYVGTHNTGVRGTKEMGMRPKLAVLDDLLSDEDARSATVIASIEDTVYKAIDYALHPKHNKVIWSGTPFNARDPLYKAVESGAWKVNVFPVCEKFPCEKEEFKGAWEDRFSYEDVLEKYTKALKTGKIDTFNQEMMLRIMSDEDRLVTDNDIVWYERSYLLKNKGLFNFYITTDFATSEKSSSDFSVISVWAYNNNGDWLWCDGIVKRQLMDKNIDDLFRLCSMYRPQEVGIEISGQQKGFISWIRNEMMVRNIYFALASDSPSGDVNQAGIRPTVHKMARFNIVLPLFKAKKIFFPEEMRNSPEIREALEELTLAAVSGFKSKHDDFIDTISMLGNLRPWKPTQTADLTHKDEDIWGWEDEDRESSAANISSYVV